MPIAIILPELGTEYELAPGEQTGGKVRVSAWLVDLGDSVETGERIVEVLVRGMTFDVAAPASGILSGILKPLDAVVTTGDTLGWIESVNEDDEKDA